MTTSNEDVEILEEKGEMGSIRTRVSSELTEGSANSSEERNTATSFPMFH